MKPAARRRRAIIRDRRRLGWDTGGHPGRCGCVDCNAQYGALHAPLCRCRECVDYGPLGYLYQDPPFAMISKIEFTAPEGHAPDPDCSGVFEECECGGPSILAPITGFDLFLITKYTNPQGS